MNGRINFEIQILARVLNRPVMVYGDRGTIIHAINAVNNLPITGQTIPVHYNGHNHYNALITQDRGLTRNITSKKQFDDAAAYNVVQSVINNITDNVLLKKLMHYFEIRNLVRLAPIILLNPNLDPDTLYKLAREVNTTDLLTLIVNHPNARDNQQILLATLNNPNVNAYLTDQIQANHVIAITDPQILAAIDRNSGRTNTERAIIIEEVLNNPTSDLYNVIPMDLQPVVLSFSFAGNNPSAQNDAAVLAFYQGIHQQREQYRIQQAAAIAQSSHAEATNTSNSNIKRDRNEDESDSEHDNHDNKPPGKRRRTRSPSPK